MKGPRVIARGSPEWPASLDELGPHMPPRSLFVLGRPLPQAAVVAIVGTRRPSAAGVEVAAEVSNAFGESGWTVVSGLAVGIDAVAHRAALGAGGTTVAVLGCGLDIDYPRRNRRLKGDIAAAGTLVSEYEVGTPPRAAHFPQRNRLIVGLASAVVVVEGGLASGALITARLGLDANRQVFALPGSVRNPMAAGPNELIRTCQAAPFTCVQHIFDELAPGLVWGEPTTDRKAAELDGCERAVLAILDDAPAAPDWIGQQLDLEPGKVALALARLEVRGLALRRRGLYEITGAGARARGAIPVA